MGTIDPWSSSWLASAKRWAKTRRSLAKARQRRRAPKTCSTTTRRRRPAHRRADPVRRRETMFKLILLIIAAVIGRLLIESAGWMPVYSDEAPMLGTTIGATVLTLIDWA